MAHPVFAYFSLDKDSGLRPGVGTPNAIPRVWEPFFAWEPPAEGMLAHTCSRAGPPLITLEARKRQTPPTRPLRPCLRWLPISSTRLHVSLRQEAGGRECCLGDITVPASSHRRSTQRPDEPRNDRTAGLITRATVSAGSEDPIFCDLSLAFEGRRPIIVGAKAGRRVRSDYIGLPSYFILHVITAQPSRENRLYVYLGQVIFWYISAPHRLTMGTRSACP